MKNKYFWMFDKEQERFDGSSKSIEGCIKDARKEKITFDDCFEMSTIYIGELREYFPKIDVECLLEELEEYAYNEVGESAEDCYFSVDKKAIGELNEKLNKVLRRWFDKYNLGIEVGDATAYKEYDIETGKQRRNTND